ncbi:MAG: hypothetical protein AAB345_03545 [Patescibacteria group bacterium]
MKYLFLVGFFGVLAGLTTGLVMNDYLLGILFVLSGIGTILFTLPFLALPIPLDLNLKMTVTHKCGDKDDDDKQDWGPVVGQDDDDDK